LSSSCTICQNSSSTFEEARISFRHHTKVDHDIWLYPNYIYYLSRKNDRDYTGDEIEIWTKYEKGDESWMPHKQTIYLEVSFI
jgi:hypothetical protein